MAARVSHPNVVATIEVVEDGDDVFLVLEHVHGVSLAALAKALRSQNKTMPPDIASAVIAGVLAGLHAAHEAMGTDGLALGLVHRDVSPQNILIGVDGLPRVIDFGIAKAAGRAQHTETGQLKGKLSYMAPEQLHNKADRRADVFSAGIVLWELLTGRRLFDFSEPAAITQAIQQAPIKPPSKYNASVNGALDAVVCQALARPPEARWQTARTMAHALEQAQPTATSAKVAAFLAATMPDHLREKARALAQVQSDSAPLPASRREAENGAQTPTITTFAAAPASGSVATRRMWPYVAVAAFAVVASAYFTARPQQPKQAPPSPPAAIVAPQPEVHRIETLAPTPSAPAVDPPAAASNEVPMRPIKRRRDKPKTKRADCDPPYWLDGQGVRKPKLECL